MGGPEEEDGFDPLDALGEMFEDLGYDGPTPEQLARMYQVFEDDFRHNPLTIQGKALRYNPKKSHHPVCRGKAQAFEHIITRENKHKGKREFDRQRANRIHWIRVILTHSPDPRIKYFERKNDQGQNQHYYWYEEKGFIIILREIQPAIMLITSFAVDALEKDRFRRQYLEYRT